MTHISEEAYTKELLNQLNSICPGWSLGDKENSYKSVQSADLVNHSENLAIEVKDDFSEEAPEPTPGVIYSRTRSSETLSDRYKPDIEDAHDKFKNYDSYETAVIIRFYDFDPFISIYYILGGLVRLSSQGRIPNTDVNISRNCSNCSLFAFYNEMLGALQFYRNPLSLRKQDKIANVMQKLNFKIKEITKSDFVS